MVYSISHPDKIPRAWCKLASGAGYRSLEYSLVVTMSKIEMPTLPENKIRDERPRKAYTGMDTLSEA